MCWLHWVVANIYKYFRDSVDIWDDVNIVFFVFLKISYVKLGCNLCKILKQNKILSVTKYLSVFILIIEFSCFWIYILTEYLCISTGHVRLLCIINASSIIHFPQRMSTKLNFIILTNTRRPYKTGISIFCPAKTYITIIY